MRYKLIQTMLVGALIATCASAPMSAVAQKGPEEIRVSTLRLVDADLRAAIDTLTGLTGIKFVLESTDFEFKPVTLNVKDVSAEEAIRLMCLSAGAEYRRDPSGVYVIGHNLKKPDSGNTEAAPTKAIKRVSKKIKLQKADALDVYLKLGGSPGLEPGYGFKQLKDFMSMTDPLQTKFYGRMPILANSSGNTTPVPIDKIGAAESGGDIRLPNESANQFEGPGGGRGGGGGGGGQNNGGGGNNFGGGGGGQGGGATLQGGQGLVGGSIDFISYDPTDNSLIVRGSEEDIADLQRHISMFDVAPKQVQIKVEFVTTGSSSAKSLGFDWLYERGTLITGNRPGTFALAGDPIFLSYQTGNITARMRTQILTGKGKVVQAPVIRTLNNQPASIVQQVTTSIFINQLVSVGNGQVIVAPQLVQIPITTGLAVAPRINEDGTVTCFINVPVQDFGQIRRGPNGEEVPDVLSQQISVVARVRDGDTIALGGMTRKTDQGSESRFPILGDLPVVGQFFRSKKEEKNNTELIIFVTPKVIEDDPGTGGA